MGKIIDFVALRTAFTVLVFIWSLYLTDDLLYAALITAAAAVLFFFVVGRVSKSRGKRKYTADKLDRRLALLGNKYVIELYRDAFYPNSVIVNERYFSAEDGVHYANYKFSAVGQEDVAAAYRLCKDTGLERINIICKSADRGAVALSQSLEPDFTFVGIKKLYKKLKKEYALPDIAESNNKAAFSLGGLWEIVFNKANIRYYLITGLMLSLMYLIVPFKGYYLAASTISLALAIISALKK